MVLILVEVLKRWNLVDSARRLVISSVYAASLAIYCTLSPLLNTVCFMTESIFTTLHSAS